MFCFWGEADLPSFFSQNFLLAYTICLNSPSKKNFLDGQPKWIVFVYIGMEITMRVQKTAAKLNLAELLSKGKLFVAKPYEVAAKIVLHTGTKVHVKDGAILLGEQPKG